MTTGILALLALLAGGWFWLDTTTARDRARQLARSLCNDAGVQFLDQTVSLRRTYLRRRAGGQLVIGRRFEFEFSEDGADRHGGQLEIIGLRLHRAVLEGGSIGRIIVQPN